MMQVEKASCCTFSGERVSSRSARRLLRSFVVACSALSETGSGTSPAKWRGKGSRGKPTAYCLIRIDRRRSAPWDWSRAGLQFIPPMEGARNQSSAGFFNNPSYLVGGLDRTSGLAALLIQLRSAPTGDCRRPARQQQSCSTQISGSQGMPPVLVAHRVSSIFSFFRVFCFACPSAENLAEVRDRFLRRPTPAGRRSCGITFMAVATSFPQRAFVRLFTPQGFSLLSRGLGVQDFSGKSSAQLADFKRCPSGT